jgi:MFS superfamily sulfate permease-like transporter
MHVSGIKHVRKSFGRSPGVVCSNKGPVASLNLCIATEVSRRTAMKIAHKIPYAAFIAIMVTVPEI